jgi:hypothetical protein
MTVTVLRTRLTVGVELPGDLLGEVEAYAEMHGILPPEALRYLVEAGLTAEARAQRVQEAAEPPFWAQNWSALAARAGGSCR